MSAWKQAASDDGFTCSGILAVFLNNDFKKVPDGSFSRQELLQITVFTEKPRSKSEAMFGVSVQ